MMTDDEILCRCESLLLDCADTNEQARASVTMIATGVRCLASLGGAGPTAEVLLAQLSKLGKHYIVHHEVGHA